MRFMMLMLPKGYEKAAPGAMPDAKAVAAMMKYNESPAEGRRAARARWPPPSRCPASDTEVIEVRQVQEVSDFPADVKEAADKFPELQKPPALVRLSAERGGFSDQRFSRISARRSRLEAQPVLNPI
jgi:hypothetical protein